MNTNELRTCSACKNDLVCHDQGKCLRPTLETDAEELHDPYLVRELPFCVVRIDFARRLERERDEARETIDLMCDEFQRIKAAPGCTSEIAWLCERAISGIKQRVPLIDQRDKAEKERDKARVRISELENQLAELRNPKETKEPKEQDTFEAHGLTWIKHVPGDPMPCNPDTFVRSLWRCEKHGKYTSCKSRAKYLDWSAVMSADYHTIGWNYADAP